MKTKVSPKVEAELVPSEVFEDPGREQLVAAVGSTLQKTWQRIKQRVVRPLTMVVFRHGFCAGLRLAGPQKVWMCECYSNGVCSSFKAS